MYVETDFLTALLDEDDWLHDAAVAALDEHDDCSTSLLAYAELLVLLYDRDRAEYDIDVPLAITNLLELVPVRPAAHEDVVLAAAAFVDEHGLTPFDALHAGVATARGETVLSSEQDYDRLGLERVALDPAED